MKARYTVLSLFLAVCCDTGFAQTAKPSITVGNTEVALGASAQRIVAALQKDYAVESPESSPHQGSFGNVPLSGNASSKASPFKRWLVSASEGSFPLAFIFAKGDTIVGAEHLLSRSVPGSVENVFDAFFAASEQLSNGGQGVCTLTTATGYNTMTASSLTSGMSQAAILLTCGSHRLVLERNEVRMIGDKTLNDYQVWESVGTTD